MDWFFNNFCRIEWLGDGKLGGMKISFDNFNMLFLLCFVIALPVLIKIVRKTYVGIKWYWNSFKNEIRGGTENGKVA
jgi:hypothetical protein